MTDGLELRSVKMKRSAFIKIFLGVLLFFLLSGCQQDEDFFETSKSKLRRFFDCERPEDLAGTYKRELGSSIETIALYLDSTFLQVYADSNGVDSNRGTWKIIPREKRRYANNVVFYDWMTFKDPYEWAHMNRDHEKSVFTTRVSGGCILYDDDLPEFNFCK